MKLIYVIPPVLAVLLAVETLFGEGKATGFLTDDSGAPKEYALSQPDASPSPSPTPSRVAVLKSRNPWSIDSDAGGIADGDWVSEEDDGGASLSEADGDLDSTDRKHGVPPPLVDAPPLARPTLTVAGAAVSAPRPELFGR